MEMAAIHFVPAAAGPDRDKPGGARFPPRREIPARRYYSE
jgi:hypothetical protein